MMIRERIAALREEMKKAGITAYMVPTSDFHGSEYVGAYFKCRAFLSGFTGSAGTLVVMQDMAGLWTDGRYFLQAEEQLKDTGITLYKMEEEGVPTVREFLVNKLEKGQTLGFDGRVVNAKEAEEFSTELEKKGAFICYEIDLVDKIWAERPELSKEPVMVLDVKYAGKSREEKIAEIRKKMEKENADTFILTSLDDIAWLLNIRGNDVKCNPVVLSYLVMTKDNIVLFANRKAFSEAVEEELAKAGVSLQNYHEIYAYIKAIPAGRRVFLDKKKTNYAVVKSLLNGVEMIDKTNLTLLPKAIKNSVEMENIRKAHKKDGVAVIKFIYWLKTKVAEETITELSAAAKLEEFRGEQEHYMGPSFTPIIGYGPHGAIVHYSATEDSNCQIKPKGFVLLDTGGQYLEGTTDITRTVALGPVTEEEKKYFTLVLKGNLNLSAAKFLYGCRGVNLDYLARSPLWEIGMNFNHGTGHGVGYFLNVHEAPNGFRYKLNKGKNESAVFEEGMLTSNEPGLYLEGKFGIRHENLMLCVKDEKNSYGQFMRFDTVTMVPFDLDAIEPSLLNEREKRLLNQYHKTVYAKISPYLDGEIKEWLKEATREITL